MNFKFFGFFGFLLLLNDNVLSNSDFPLFSKELLKNDSSINEEKAISDYAESIVFFVFSRIGLLENVKSEEEEIMLKKQMDSLRDKICFNKEFCKMAKSLIKEQKNEINSYKNFCKNVSFLKIFSYSFLISSMAWEFYRTFFLTYFNDNEMKAKIKTHNAISYVSKFGIPLLIFVYFEKLLKKGKVDSEFNDMKYAKSDKNIEIVNYVFENIIAPYFSDFKDAMAKKNAENQSDENKTAEVK